METEKNAVSRIFGQNVQLYRKKAGLTQEQLSERLEISQKHLSIIENGAQFASASLIDRICTELDVSVGMLFRSPDESSAHEANMISALLQNMLNPRLALIEQRLSEIERLLAQKR